mgnify:CR=1 FL=1
MLRQVYLKISRSVRCDLHWRADEHGRLNLQTLDSRRLVKFSICSEPEEARAERGSLRRTRAAVPGAQRTARAPRASRALLCDCLVRFADVAAARSPGMHVASMKPALRARYERAIRDARASHAGAPSPHLPSPSSPQDARDLHARALRSPPFGRVPVLVCVSRPRPSHQLAASVCACSVRLGRRSRARAQARG